MSDIEVDMQMCQSCRSLGAFFLKTVQMFVQAIFKSAWGRKRKQLKFNPAF